MAHEASTILATRWQYRPEKCGNSTEWLINYKNGMEECTGMKFDQCDKDNIRKTLADALSCETEVRRIVVFGSFLTSLNPHDLDVAVFQDSDENYISLAMRYRKDVRPVARQIPVDVFPLKAGVLDDPFLAEIEKGETIYER